MTPLFAGLALGLSLIVAIGAQNVFVLRQGIRREHVLAVVLVCAVSDALLIFAGVTGIGLALTAVPWLIDAARWLGAAFLVGYGIMAARRAWHPSGEALTADAASGERGATATPSPGAVATAVRASTALAPTVLTALALTWLNPHVYLDTVFLLGSIASTHGEGRWLFAIGAVIASFAWFFSLGFGARYLGRWLNSPRSWRVLDAIIAVVMIAIGISLVIPVFS
ncbi:MAG TPA: LysE/ArgO family amino acid transporter [Microbacterium sp.]|nr:LysE/ArgO family amino acid transporter [Microbacterium sp.]